MKRSLQLVLGLIFAALAFVGVILLGTLTRPPTYDVAIVVAELPPFTQVMPEMVQVDTQSLSAAVVAKYILADEWQAMVAAGPVVAVEPLHPGQPLLREQLATGDNAYKVRRLAVALTDPALTVLAIPVEPKTLPNVYAGDAVALYVSVGQLQAQSISTDVVTIPAVTPVANGAPLPVVLPPSEPQAAVTETLTLQLPLTKRLAEGLIYRLNREQKENPNYGAPGSEGEPQYIEGEIQSLDVVVDRELAEWVVYALAHGKVQLSLLPAVAIPQLQAGQFPVSPGVTWSDVEDTFFAERFSLTPTPTPTPQLEP